MVVAVRWWAGDVGCCRYDGVTCSCPGKSDDACLLQSESQVEDLIVRCKRCLNSFSWHALKNGLCLVCYEP